MFPVEILLGVFPYGDIPMSVWFSLGFLFMSIEGVSPVTSCTDCVGTGFSIDTNVSNLLRNNRFSLGVHLGLHLNNIPGLPP